MKVLVSFKWVIGKSFGTNWKIEAKPTSSEDEKCIGAKMLRHKNCQGQNHLADERARGLWRVRQRSPDEIFEMTIGKFGQGVSANRAEFDLR